MYLTVAAIILAYLTFDKRSREKMRKRYVLSIQIKHNDVCMCIRLKGHISNVRLICVKLESCQMLKLKLPKSKYIFVACLNDVSPTTSIANANNDAIESELRGRESSMQYVNTISISCGREIMCLEFVDQIAAGRSVEVTRRYTAMSQSRSIYTYYLNGDIHF